MALSLRLEVGDLDPEEELPFDGFWIARDDLHVEGFNDVRFDLIFKAGQPVKPLKDLGMATRNVVERHGRTAIVAMTINIKSFDPEIHYGIYMVQARFGPIQAYAITSLWSADTEVPISPRVSIETCSFQSAAYTESLVRLYPGSPECLICTVIGMDTAHLQMSFYQNYQDKNILLHDVENILDFPNFQRILYQMTGSAPRDAGKYTCVATLPTGVMTKSVNVTLVT